MTTVKDKIELVQNTFKEGKEKAFSMTDLNQLNDWLLNVPKEFISVAYEGASKAIALKNIKEKKSLDRWNEFYHTFGKLHGFQMHVGLGWVFSELNLGFTDVKLIIEPSLKYRVLDGYGYYEGIFKRRQSIRSQQIPSHLSELDLNAYDQGLGRSLWYISNGEVERLVKLISLFSENRHHDLWRGIGIAVAYVGGIETIAIQQLVKESGQYISAFKSGVSLLIHSRFKANTIVEDTEFISEEIFDLSCETINNCMKTLGQETISKPEHFYFDWLKRIEQEICN
jgi:enediyne biosynthesis protein E3